MGTTFDKTIGGNDTLPAKEAGYQFTLRRTYDTAATGDGNVTSGDTLQLLNIPANTLVQRVAVIKDTVESGTLTVDVGDGTDPDGFLDGADLNAAATEITELALAEAAPNTVVGYTAGKLYTAADTLDMLFNNTADTAKFTVVAICVRIKRAPDTAPAIGSA